MLEDAEIQHALTVLFRVGPALAEQLELPAENCTVADRAHAFDGVARAIRQTILLKAHLAEQQSAEARRAAVRRQVIRTVEDVIHRNARPEQVEPLRRELFERLDMPDFTVDLLTRTPAQIAAELISDFSLVRLPGCPRDVRRTPDDIVVLNARAAAPAGSGLADWVPAEAPPRQPPPNPLL